MGLKAIVKKGAKFLASFFPSNGVRIMLYRLASYDIGKDVYIGDSIIIIDRLSDRKNVIIGDRASISSGVTLVTSSSPNSSRIAPFVKTIYGKIVIGNDAWLGTGSIILPDLSVGEGAIVGAGAVVTRNVDPFTIVAGVPAKKIGEVNIHESFA
ncbi:acyltransferase [Methanolobus bombayensis]|uniref:acyltransferase n=1 Tax=Methanolobus bombayensis TaxID=38023 RepID=UPI001AE5F9B4|nr:acyltransferase [Methanolobus bombayensis]MBP1910288.1 acetyltransferase-like isoleucine patch superfamily enzyme [Methanolobus bombayensis]